MSFCLDQNFSVGCKYSKKVILTNVGSSTNKCLFKELSGNIADCLKIE